MHARILPLDEVTERDLGAWQELARRAAEANPFLEPQFVTAAARRLGADGIALLVATDGAEWVGCLPLSSSSRWHRFPARWLIGWRHPYCFLGTPLVDADRCDRAVEALVREIRESDPMRLFALEWMSASGPVHRALEAVVAELRIPVLTYETFERAALYRRPDATYLEETLSSSRRKELRRLGRRLGDELEAPLEVRNLTGEPRAYEDFMRLEASGWKGREATALSSSSEHAAFFRELCDSFHSEGRLQLLALGTPSRVAAMQCNLLAGDAVFCFKVAYDEELRRYSPGVQLEVHAIDVFHRQTQASLMDSCAEADDELMNRLWPDRRRLATIVLPAKGFAAKAWRHGVGIAAALRRRMRRAR
jgi:CelD/BcsL family acetyltransferase involved in cellulose biosynthesis